jgi:hypothetical protein
MSNRLLILILLAGCASATKTIPSAWRSVPEATRIRSVTLAANGTVTPSAAAAPAQRVDGPIRVAAAEFGEKIMNAGKPLTEPFRAIDSLDWSESRGEVAFSAKREQDFDIGLVSTDGGAVHWMPGDPADEVLVEWAPRGNKISYVIRAAAGDVVRTLHIPSSYQFGIPFANGTIHAVAWDPPAEHYAVAWSTPDASDRVDVLEYDGGRRRTMIAPAVTLDVEVAPFAPGAVVLRPRDVRYDEKLPLVVWVDDAFSWSDARAALLKNAHAAVVITKNLPDAALWTAAAQTAWLDPKRTFIVTPTPLSPQPSALSPAPTIITADPTVPPGRSLQKDRVVTVAPAVLQSFAAGFIADQLERTAPTHGSSR